MKTLREYDTRPLCALSHSAAATLISNCRSEWSASASASAADRRRPALTRNTISSVVIPKDLLWPWHGPAAPILHAPAPPTAQARKRLGPPAYRYQARRLAGAARSG